MARVQAPTPAWEKALAGVLLTGWFGCLVLVVASDLGPRLVWTAFVASLPLTWLLMGFHVWRRVCPLAAISQLPKRLGKPGTRKIQGTWAEQALLVQLGLMVLALTGRLLATNGSGLALAVMFIALTVAAVVVGAVWRGRSWCHFVCPVGLVEKVYLEPVTLLGTRTSQCQPCSACTKHCQDIQLEQGYWKLAASDARRVAYYAWPGVVFAFYLAFRLQSGSWEGYFSGTWTAENPAVWGPGLAALPAVPWAVAAPLVLATGGLASFLVFAAGERWGATRWDEGRVRHRTLALAGFVGFNVFYAFAGQPTLRMFPGWIRWTVATAVVLLSAAVLFRRWPRTEQDFVRERFAARLRKKWSWDEAAGELDSREVVRLHEERTKAHQARLEAYRETLVELASAGTLKRADLATIATVRRQFGVSDQEHDKILAKLDPAAKAALDRADALSPEQALQEEHLRREIEALVAATVAVGASPDPAVLARLREEHGLDEERWAALWAEVVEPSSAVAGAWRADVGELSALAGALVAVRRLHEDAASFGERVARWHRARLEERLRAVAGVVMPGRAEPLTELLDELAEGPLTEVEALRDALAVLDGGEGAAGPVEDFPMLAGLVGGQLERLVQLHGVELFASLAPDGLARVAGLAATRTWAAGEELCAVGDEGDEVFVVLSGEVAISLPGDAAPRAVLGPGACLGELAVLDPAPRSATVRAVDEVETLVLEGPALRELASSEPGLALELATELARRLRRAG